MSYASGCLSCLLQEVSSSVEPSSELGGGGGGGNRKRHWPAYVPPTHPNPHMFIQPTNADKGPNGLVNGRLRLPLPLSFLINPPALFAWWLSTRS